MRIGINQPYLLPYKGYFDLIASVDKFVIYDDAQYIKGGWINRNQFPNMFTFRLERHSDYAKINECYFKDIEEDKKIFKRKFPRLIHNFLKPMQQSYNLSYNITLSLQEICKDLGIKTPFYFSSQFKHGKFVRGILDIVKALDGDTYVNLPGGKKLYYQEQFGDIKLEFIETIPSSSILCGL